MRVIVSSLTAAVLVFAVARALGGHDAAAAAGLANETREVSAASAPPTALANDNRTPAGTLVGDTLVVRLAVGPAAWYIHDEKAGAFLVLAFAEEGKPPTIPAPLIRVAAGTTIQVAVQNPLADSLIVHGLGTRGDGVPDSLIVPPGVTRSSRFSAGREGTYLYWATTTDVPPRRRTLPGRALNTRQLAGAFVIDPPGKAAPDDRIFVITQHLDQDVSRTDRPLFDHGLMARDFPAINGKSWPHTERLAYALGDSIRWRVINASNRPHPMHLHGFYFRVDARGNALRDRGSIYSTAERAMAVTEVVEIGETMAMVWSPDRPGGWIFHCHITQHAALQPPVDRRDALEFPPHHAHSDPDQHALTGMNGLVLGITVRGSGPAAPRWRPARRLRLFVQSDSAPGDSARRFGYVLQRGAAEPARDSVEFPGPVLVLTRGEPTSIQVVNRTGEPTAVHWHGIELESYYDGIVGWSGTPGARTAPAIRPGATFEVRITPRRAGTFMYHTHFDELRQQFGGLVGAIVVLEPGERWDLERDRVFMLSDGRSRSAELDRVALQFAPFGRDLAINGSVAPPPMELRVGITYRFRFANLLVDRPLLHVRLVRDSTLLSWRRVAKDGFALSGAQAAARPSPQRVGSGETVDVEYTPDRSGDMMLEFGSGPQFPYVFAKLRVRVRE
jgi:FtsP/CotA-like multicopper oxidase with cupredoxin domain